MADQAPLPGWIGEHANQLVGYAIRVPRSRDPDTCPACHGPATPTTRHCSDCMHLHRLVARMGGQPVDQVIPIMLVDTSVHADSPFAFWLQGPDPYELEVHGQPGEHPPWQPRPNPRVLPRLTATLIQFLHNHLACLRQATGGWDLIVPIPDTVYPLVTNSLLGALRRFEHPAAPLLAGKQPVPPRQPTPDAFALQEPAARPPPTVLLVDTLLQTGTRLQSAAWTLQREGIPVAGAVPLGRAVADTDDTRAFLGRHRGRFTLDRCAVHARPQTPGQTHLF